MGIDIMPPAPPHDPKPKLIHESLHGLPQGVRFGISGVLCNAIFIAGFNLAVEQFEHMMPASRIYSIFYMCYIPVGHAINSLLVFGWPDAYLSSLMSNAPIGLTAMAIGTFCTGYFDSIDFEVKVDNFFVDNFSFLGFKEPEPEEEKSEFYSSLVVLVITSVWSYVLSMYVNAPKPKKAEGKEL